MMYKYIMNIKIIVILVLCFDVTIQQKRLMMNILKSKVNLFYKINFKIHDITNKLFLVLKSDKNFTTSNHFQMLLTMHFYFNSISESNYKVYEDLKNISTANFGKRYKNNLDVLLETTVEDVIDILINNFKKLTNRTCVSEFANNIIKYNGTEYSKDNFIKSWSALSDKTIEFMIDLIINENENMGSNTTKISYNTIKHNGTEASLENFHEIWSKLSDKSNENITDPIISESKGLDATEFSPMLDSSSQELKNWHSEIKDNSTRRIYKGKKTSIKNYPFIASLNLMSEFLCVGSIISMDMVLTAASCLQIAYKNKLYRNNPRTIFVRIGSDRTKRSGKLIPIIQVIFHPKYDSVTLKHNLAIVKMLKKLKHMKKTRIKKIKYDRNADVLQKSVKEITILGWGARGAKDNAKGLQRLTVAHLDVYNIKDCKEVYSKYYVTDTNFCAGFTSKGGGACTGDVGGPAVVAEDLVGVVSFGPTVCGMPDAPTVFTKIGYYAQWIDEVLNKTLAKKKTTTRKTSNILIISLYTTASYAKHPVSYTNRARSDTTRTFSHTDRTVSHTKSERRPNMFTLRPLGDDSGETQILKKLISEFILGNHTVVDYLTNLATDDDEKESIEEDITKYNEKLFLDPKMYTKTYADLLVDTNKTPETIISTISYKAGKYYINYNNKSKSTISQIKGFLQKQSTVPQVTSITGSKREQSDYDGQPTKLATFVESSEFPDDDFSSDLDVKSSLTDDSSSYYGMEIPMDSQFRAESPLEKLVTYNNEIDLLDFVKNKLMMTTGSPKVTKLTTINISEKSGSFNVYHKMEPGLVDDKTKHNERGIYNIYHKTDFTPVDHKKQQTKHNEGGIYNNYHKMESGPADDKKLETKDNEKVIYNIYHKTVDSIPVAYKKQQTKHNERDLYNIYHKMEHKGVDDENVSDNNEFSTSDNRDKVVHFVTGEIPSRARSKPNYYDEITKDNRRTRKTDTAPKGMAMTISLEDFNY